MCSYGVWLVSEMLTNVLVCSAFVPCDQPQNSLNYLTLWWRMCSYGVWLVSEMLTYVLVCSAFAPCDQPQNSLNYLTLRWRMCSFGVWLGYKMLTYLNSITSLPDTHRVAKVILQ